MSQLQIYQDPTGSMTQEKINAKNNELIMQEMNRGVDATSIQRRSISPGQFRLLSYRPNPIQLLTFGGGSPVPAGGHAFRIINFQNDGLTAAAGQSFLPIFYIDYFVDPPDTSSTSALYSGGYIYPDGTNMTSATDNVTFSWYLRNSTPGTSQDVVSYIITARNDDVSAHTYWTSMQLLLPADGNLNPGSVASYLP